MKKIITLFLALFLVPTFVGAYDLTLLSADKTTITVVSSKLTTKMETLKATRAAKTVVSVSAAIAADIGPCSLTVSGNRANIVYDRGTRTGTFKVYRGHDLVVNDFQPTTPGQIVGASISGSVFTWTCNLDAFDPGEVYFRIAKTQ